MKPDVKERMIKRLLGYMQQVNGFPTTYENELYLVLLDDSTLRKVYAKWKKWATTGKVE